MKFLSVCSGIESASVAWNPLGWEALAFSEIEPFPCAVLKHHYPDVPNLGDMTKINGADYAGNVDVLVGGTPCQAFSVAGLRAGLVDPRGNLTLVFAKLADDIAPPYVVWENVPGVLSSKDNAFGCFLGLLAGEDDALQPPGGKWTDAGYVLGPQRAVAWRVLDAQYFGLAQRRRRVFVVACPRGGADPREILFEREGLRRDTPPSREAGQGATHDVAPCIGASGRGFERGGDTRGQDPVVGVFQQSSMKGKGTIGWDGSGIAKPVKTQMDGQMVCFGGNNTSGPIDVATARNASGSASGRLDFESETFAVSVSLRGREGGGACEMGDDKACAQRASQGGGDKPHVLVGNSPIETTEETWLICGECGERFQDKYATGIRTLAPAECPKCGEEENIKIVGIDMVAFHPTQDPISSEDGSTHALGCGSSGGQASVAVTMAMQVRRLTPRECCRLQGFPDDYTLVPWRGKPAEVCPDGPRYKALGNSKAVPVVRWIGNRIEAVEEILRRKA